MYYAGNNIYRVSIGSFTEDFTQIGTQYNAREATGSKLTRSGTSWTYTQSNGTYAFFEDKKGLVNYKSPLGPVQIYDYFSKQVQAPVSGPPSYYSVYRLSTISDTAGWRADFSYDSDDTTPNYATVPV